MKSIWWMLGGVLLILLLLVTFLYIVYSILFQSRWVIKLIAKYEKRAFFYFDTKERVIALTIDDSPSNQTEQFVALLKQYNAHATFFVIGDRIKEREEKLIQIVEAGNEIGNHTLHDEPSFKNTPTEFAEKVLQKYKWFRPGSGLPSSFMFDTIDNLNYRMVIGSNYAFDAQTDNTTFTSFLLRHSVSNGSIVVCHDRPYNIAEVENFLQYCQKNHIEVLSLGEMAERVYNSQPFKMDVPIPTHFFSQFALGTPDELSTETVKEPIMPHL
ncbi:hypothetical protein EIN_080830 [Entamoeba invadens IP1]|uniref:hypothetical protein n=1 Tax=Entamoeba invadens IP1 TaxID=370355 RepID=UPI0002C3E4D2|nr:hypothetical protein EIN_080830 [Entamoeba invadens IP1]ELP85111.1 hypothetical protein EIN_080830 [Entamoeba invadens IP1]|eukprot:XP_004184457.1 hypothetical protein EIN_080830 [Entamoeba invadens IP1]